MYQKPTVPLTIGGVLDDTIRLYKAAFLPCLAPALLAGLTVGLLGYDEASQLPAPTSGNLDLQALLSQNLAATSGPSLSLSLLEVLIQMLFYGVMIYITAGVSRGAAPPFVESFGAGLRRLPSMAGAAILMAIIGTIGVIVVAIPLFIFMLGGHWKDPLPQMAAQIAPSLLASLLLSIPLIYVVSRLWLFLVPLVVDSQGPAQSLGTSWRVMGGHWWRSSTIIFVMFVIMYVLAAVLVLLAGSVSVAVTGLPKGAAQMISAMALVTSVINGLTQIVIGPMTAATLLSLYNDLVLRRGGADLEARLDALPRR